MIMAGDFREITHRQYKVAVSGPWTLFVLLARTYFWMPLHWQANYALRNFSPCSSPQHYHKYSQILSKLQPQSIWKATVIQNQAINGVIHHLPRSTHGIQVTATQSTPTSQQPGHPNGREVYGVSEDEAEREAVLLASMMVLDQALEIHMLSSAFCCNVHMIINVRMWRNFSPLCLWIKSINSSQWLRQSLPKRTGRLPTRLLIGSPITCRPWFCWTPKAWADTAQPAGSLTGLQISDCFCQTHVCLQIPP